MAEPAGVSETQVKNAQKLFVGAASGSQQQGSSRAAGAPSEAAQQRMQAYASGCPVVGGGQPAQLYGGGCPVVGVNPSNQMPQSSNDPQPGQSKPLSQYRVRSTIPTGDAVPEHQAGSSDGVWVYPSEQMFFNAMKRKGWAPSEDDMTAVVAIHNAVNERAWREILRWEAAHGGTPPRLVRFRGRPQDFSPKARLLNLLGYKLPFDRHDWVVERDGREVRYVIDFYNAAPLPTMPVAMHLDVRPALDSPAAAWDRLRMQFKWMASGRWRGE